MMYQPRVNNTQTYYNHVVTRAKLLTFPYFWADTEQRFLIENGQQNFQNPVLYSEHEEIEKGDFIINIDRVEPNIIHASHGGKSIGWKKVLALPEHFNDHYLHLINSGKLQSDNELLVKCYTDNTKWGSGPIKKIHLNKQNHITLFSVKENCPECGSFHINTRHIQGGDGTTAKWEECDQCSEIIDNTSKQSLDNSKELNRLRSTINSLQKITDSNMSNKRKLNHISITLLKLKEWYG